MAGKKGTSQGSVDAVFKDRLTDLVLQAREAAGGITGSGQTVWQLPQGWKDEDRDVFDIAKLHEPDFDRKNLNELYETCVKAADGAGTVGDVISIKQQIDYNAAEERALRLRHASTVRCLVHAGARQSGFDESQVFPSIEAQAADLIKAGAL